MHVQQIIIYWDWSNTFYMSTHSLLMFFLISFAFQMHIHFFYFHLVKRYTIYHSLHVLLPNISHHCLYIFDVNISLPCIYNHSFQYTPFLLLLCMLYCPTYNHVLYRLFPCMYYEMNTLYTIALYVLLQGCVLLPCMYYCPLYSIALYVFPVYIIALTCGVYYILYGNLCTCLAWLFGFFLIYFFHFFFDIKPVRFLRVLLTYLFLIWQDTTNKWW